MKYKEELKKPKIVIFDWDDTLVDTGRFLKGILGKVLEELNISEWDKEAAIKYSNHSLREAFPRIFGDKWEDVRDVYYERIRQEQPDQVQVIPDALEMVKTLLDNQTLVSIVSNKNSMSLNDDVNKLQWRKYFHSIVGATDAERDKPWPEPVEMALEGIEINNDEDQMWFVGDSIIDIQCAQNTNCVPILFGHKAEAIEQVKELRIPHIHVSSHQDLIKLYNNVLNK